MTGVLGLTAVSDGIAVSPVANVAVVIPVVPMMIPAVVMIVIMMIMIPAAPVVIRVRAVVRPVPVPAGVITGRDRLINHVIRVRSAAGEQCGAGGESE